MIMSDSKVTIELFLWDSKKKHYLPVATINQKKHKVETLSMSSNTLRIFLSCY